MVSETVGNLFQAAAEEANVVDSGNTLSTAELASALDRLQRLIDSSNASKPMIYGESYSGLLSLTALQQSYTIGIDPTGQLTADLNVARPVKITRANLLLNSTIRQPIQVTEDSAKWAAIRYQQNYGPSRLCYFDRNFSSHGFATLWFYQIPDASYQWEFWSWIQNPVVTSVNDTLNYPPGYALYWLYTMAKVMCAMFGRQVPSAVQDGLIEAKDVIAGLNSPSPELRPDPALIDDGGELYNWLSGESEY